MFAIGEEEIFLAEFDLSWVPCAIGAVVFIRKGVLTTCIIGYYYGRLGIEEPNRTS